MIPAHTLKEPASCLGWMKSRLSAEVWYSGKAPPNAPHQTANREIEARRTILPLVVAVGGKVENL